MALQVFEKYLRFLENLFQSESIEIVQNFQWLSHKSMPISQMEGYFKNPYFKRTYAFSVGFKMKPLRKIISLCQDKNQFLPQTF